MTVLERTKMPDGTEIQLENWKEDLPHIFDTLSIGAYPKAKRGRYWIREDEPFRLDLARGFTSDDMVRETFSALELGAITLEELDEHYWNGNKDRYFMGLAGREVFNV